MTQYLNTKTGTIHLVSHLPKPARNGFTQCGQLPITALTQLTSKTRMIHGGYRFCKRCDQLIGLQ